MSIKTSKELFRDVSSYLTIDQLIVLSMTSMPSLFFGLNNLRFNRFIPSDNDANKIGLSELIKSGASNKEILRSIKECKDINYQDNKVYVLRGQTPLYHAVFKRNIEIIKALVKMGADANIAGRWISPLTMTDDFDIIKILVNAGADVNNPKYHGNIIPLNRAIRWDSVDSVNFLISKGAHVNLLDSHGSTPLILAVKEYSNNLDIINTLIENGADINLRGGRTSGRTPLHYAVNYFREDSAVIRVLIEAGANPGIKDFRSNKTPLEASRYYFNLHYNNDDPAKNLESGKELRLNVITMLENYEADYNGI